ncbi:MAG TPA: hypothetical protein VEP90_28550 [Methylomirabilota bacterium]|nr:hypothetical protein [Methylomirabilota bacterium]
MMHITGIRSIYLKESPSKPHHLDWLTAPQVSGKLGEYMPQVDNTKLQMLSDMRNREVSGIITCK